MDIYPLMFQGRYKSVKESLIPFGLDCGNGWYWLINNLCSCIQDYINANSKSQTEALQVKEKFGALRFYVRGADEYIYGMISLAESMSYSTCESCGCTTDILHTSGWIKTLCKTCAPE